MEDERENEREPLPMDAVLGKLEPYLPVEVRDLRASSEESRSEAEKRLGTAFFLQPKLAGRLLSPSEEAGMSHLQQGRGWPSDPARVDLNAEKAAREAANAAVLSEEAKNWKSSRKGGSAR